MPVTAIQDQTETERPDGAEYDRLKKRLDLAQLEQTVAALHESLPPPKAREAEDTMRRMFKRAHR